MHNPWKLLTRTEREFGRDHCPQMAAAISYHALFSFIPLLTLLLAILAFVLRDPRQQQSAVERVLATLPLQPGNFVDSSIRSLSTQTGALTLLAVLGMLWGASGLFGSIREALNIAWGADAKRGFLMDKLVDFGAVLGLGALLIASLAGTILIHFLQTLSVSSTGAPVSGPLQTAYTVAGVLVPAAFSFFAFLLLYRNVPNVHHRASDVWPGALVATLLFELGKHGFALYVSHFNRYQAVYGALGAVMLFMLWTWVSAIILLFGAELAAEYEKLTHGRPAQNEPSVLLEGHPHIAGR